MKTTLYCTLTLLTFVSLAFVPSTITQDNLPEYLVRVIYFIPNDREPDPNMDKKLDRQMKDADIEDTHTINAYSDDMTIATVSVNDTSVTVAGKTEGMTMITVSATDDSGQDNATSTPVTFKVTVNEPPLSPPIRANRVCEVGMTLGPGESCGYGPLVVFSVREDGSACRASSEPIYHNVFGIDVRIDNPSICGNYDIEQDAFFNTIFSASKNEDGTWTIKKVPAFNIY